MNEDFYKNLDEQITNITTALMAIRDIATYTDIPITVKFDNNIIKVAVNFGKCNVKTEHFYLQDMYRYHQSSDKIYKWIKEAVEEIVKFEEGYFMSKTIKDIIHMMDETQISLLKFLVGYSVKKSKFHPIIIQYKNGGKPIEGDHYIDRWYQLFNSFTDEQKLVTIDLCRKAMNANYYLYLGEIFINNLI